MTDAQLVLRWTVFALCYSPRGVLNVRPLLVVVKTNDSSKSGIYGRLITLKESFLIVQDTSKLKFFVTLFCSVKRTGMIL